MHIPNQKIFHLFKQHKFVGLFVKTSIRHFFGQPSTSLRRTVNVCKLRVHFHDVCNIPPPTYISVNCVKTLLDVIRSNFLKTVVSNKTVQSFCSDVVAKNVNVISSPTCNIRFYVSKNIIVFHQSDVLC